MKKQESTSTDFSTFKKLNDYLFRALDRLDNDKEIIRDSNYVARANAIIGGAKAVLNVARVEMQLTEMKEMNMDINPIIKSMSKNEEENE